MNQPMISNQLHFYGCEVSFDLADAGGVLHHPNYLVLFERARAAALETAGYSFFELWKDKYSLAVKENLSEYFRPVLMGDQLIILTSLVEATKVRVEVIQQMVKRSYFLSMFPNLSTPTPPNGFLEMSLSSISIPKDALYHQVKMSLACITFTEAGVPFKATRLPQRLRQALQLTNSSEEVE